jgi:hypothetical protein
MSRHCTICTSKHRYSIDLAVVARVPYRVICERYGIPHVDALKRHVKAHLSPNQRAAMATAIKPNGVGGISLDELRKQEGEGLLANFIAQRTRL